MYLSNVFVYFNYLFFTNLVLLQICSIRLSHSYTVSECLNTFPNLSPFLKQSLYDHCVHRMNFEKLWNANIHNTPKIEIYSSNSDFHNDRDYNVNNRNSFINRLVPSYYAPRYNSHKNSFNYGIQPPNNYDFYNYQRYPVINRDSNFLRRPSYKPDFNYENKNSHGSPSDFLPSDSSICGTVARKHFPAIGTKVSAGEFPWLVALFSKQNIDFRYLCGANLVSQRHIVTVAHCFYDEDKSLLPKSRLFFILGTPNISMVMQNKDMLFSAADYWIHEEYVSPNDFMPMADLAVVKLDKPVIFTDFVRPICLWTKGTSLNLIENKRGTVVGWGIKDAKTMKTAMTPRKVDIPVVSQRKCLKSHQSFENIISSRTFCAGSRDKSGPCMGTSGSGFVSKIHGKWTLRGLVSSSLIDNGTCDLAEYILFTDLSKFQSWLKIKLQK